MCYLTRQNKCIFCQKQKKKDLRKYGYSNIGHDTSTTKPHNFTIISAVAKTLFSIWSSKARPFLHPSASITLYSTEESKKQFETTDSEENVDNIAESPCKKRYVRKLSPIRCFSPRNENRPNDRKCNEVIESLFLQKNRADNAYRKGFVKFGVESGAEKTY